MSNKKHLWVFIFLMLMFINADIVFADSVSTRVDLDQVSINSKRLYKNYLIGNSKHISKQFYISVKGKGDNSYVPVYCLDFGKSLSSGTSTWKRTNLESVLNNADAFNRINLIAYYGYEYNDGTINHNNKKYYVAAQALIWESLQELGWSGGRKFNNLTFRYGSTSYGKGTLLDLTSEKNEILGMVSKHSIKPSMCDTTIQLGTGTSFSDDNGVLTKYEITSGGDRASISGNTLVIGNASESFSINLKLKGANTSAITYVYSKSSAQRLLRQGYVSNSECIVNFVKTGENIRKIRVLKLDSETGNPLANAQFSLYDSNNHLVETLTSGNDGYATSKVLTEGTYYITEIKSPDGYIISNEKVWVTVTDNKVYSVTIDNDPDNPGTGDMNVFLFVGIAMMTLLVAVGIYNNDKILENFRKN